MTSNRGMQDLQDFEDVFRALANKTRRQILTVLRARGGSMSAGEIANRFSCSWPATSRHLKRLHEIDLISLKKEGKEYSYQLNRKKLLSTTSKWLKKFEKE